MGRLGKSVVHVYVLTFLLEINLYCCATDESAPHNKPEQYILHEINEGCGCGDHWLPTAYTEYCREGGMTSPFLTSIFISLAIHQHYKKNSQ